MRVSKVLNTTDSMKARISNDSISSSILRQEPQAGGESVFLADPTPTAELISVVYVSSAIAPFTDAELVDLLTKSRAKNTLAGITGMLVYKGGNFMQLIEGEAAAIDALIVRIGEGPAALRAGDFAPAFHHRTGISIVGPWASGICTRLRFQAIEG